MNEARLKVGIILIGAAAAWAVPFFMFTPGDFIGFLGPWYRHILSAGPVAAFSQPFGNYAPPYLYLLAALGVLDGFVRPIIAIKLLSTAGAIWLAYSIFNLLRACGADAPLEAAAWSFVLPTVVLNVPLLAQADTFWVAPCVLAVAASLRGKPVKMALWASVGFAFKAQAVFVAPFVSSMLIRHRAPLWAWFTPAAVYLLAIAPAWAAGWPLDDLLTIYLRQAQWHPPGEDFISTAPNIWMLVKLFAPRSFIAAVGVVAAFAAAAAYVVWLRKAAADASSLIAAAALSGALLPFLLPGMHERFFALSEVLSFCLAWIDRRRLWAAIGAQAAFLFNAGGMLGGGTPMLLLGVAAELATIWLLLRAARPIEQREVAQGANQRRRSPPAIPSRDFESDFLSETRRLKH